MEHNLAKKDIGVQVNEKLDIKRQYVLRAQKANFILVCIKRHTASKPRGVILPHCSPLVKPYLKYHVQLWGKLSTGKTWTCWDSSRGGPQKWSVTPSCEEGLREMELFTRTEGSREVSLWPFNNKWHLIRKMGTNLAGPIVIGQGVITES